MVAVLMAYLSLIIQARWDYEDPVWQRYNEAFQDMAAATQLQVVDFRRSPDLCRMGKEGMSGFTFTGYGEESMEPTKVPPPKRPVWELRRS